MFKNYFLIAWRNIQRNKGYTFLNITGLAFGLATFIVGMLYINYETSFDKWDKQLNNVYRVDITQTIAGNAPERTIWSPYPLGSKLAENCPEVQSVTRIYDQNEGLIATPEKQLYINKVISADSSFLNVFPYKLLYGSHIAALNQPRQAILSLATSQKIFGSADPIGKTFTFNNNKTYTVSGVFDSKGPSHLDFNICLSFSPHNPDKWMSPIYFTYVLLRSGVSTDALAQKAKLIMTNGLTDFNYSQLKEDPNISRPLKESGEWLKRNVGVSVDEIYFEPIQGIHLNPKAASYKDAASSHPLINSQSGNEVPVILFAIAATLVLVLACINYINLSIARAGKRAKETGVRKVIGASRNQLIIQFLIEAFLQCLVALAFSLLLAHWMANLMNLLFGMQLSLFNKSLPSQNLIFGLQLFLLILLVTLFSGVYPAFIQSSFKPVKVLKGIITRNIGGQRLRDCLIVLQFSISACFIIGMLVVYKQLHYMSSKDPGFNTQQVVVLQPNSPDLISMQMKDNKIDLIKSQLMHIPHVENVTTSDVYPGKPSMASQIDADFNKMHGAMTFNYIHFDYFKTLSIKIISGRDFSISYSADTVNNAVINETAARQMGYSDPIGKTVSILNREYNIIGVVKDNNIAGYNSKIPPEIYAIGAVPNMLGSYRAILVKIDGRNAAETVKSLEDYWKTIEPGYPLVYSWLDHDFAMLIDKYERFGKLTMILSGISIFIALMGIFTLSAFAVAQRTKEVGIRKVFGASVTNITTMLSSSFLKLIFIALAIAFPISYWSVNRWLEQFAYRIENYWLIFLLSGFCVMVAALLTVSVQTIKAAIVNPIESLRDQ